MGEIGFLGFWIFIAVAVASDAWSKNKKREANHETARRIIESGKPIDQDLIERLLEAKTPNTTTYQKAKAVGVFWLMLSAGLGVFAVFLAFIEKDALFAMLGIASVVAFIGLGLIISSNYAQKWQSEAQLKSNDQ